VENFNSVKRPIKAVKVTQRPKIEPPVFNMALQGVSKDGNNKLHDQPEKGLTERSKSTEKLATAIRQELTHIHVNELIQKLVEANSGTRL